MVPRGRDPSAAADRFRYDSTSSTVFPRPFVTPSIIESKNRCPDFTSSVRLPFRSHRYRERNPRELMFSIRSHCAWFGSTGPGTYQLTGRVIAGFLPIRQRREVGGARYGCRPVEWRAECRVRHQRLQFNAPRKIARVNDVVDLGSEPPVVDGLQRGQKNRVVEVRADALFLEVAFHIEIQHVGGRNFAQRDVMVGDRLRVIAVGVHQQQHIFWAAAGHGRRSQDKSPTCQRGLPRGICAKYNRSTATPPAANRS